MIDPANFRKVLGNYPTGVCAVTAMDSSENPIAMIVGSFTSVSLDPPLVGFFPGRNSQSWAQLEQAGKFCINVLASHQGDLCRQMAVSGGDKFAGIDYTASAHGAPLIKGALASFDCTLHSVMEAGDHFVVLGHVDHLDVYADGDPMLFFRGRYGGFRELI